MPRGLRRSESAFVRLRSKAVAPMTAMFAGALKTP